MKWNRKAVIDFCNECIFPFVRIDQWTYRNGELWAVVEMVHKFRRENGFPEEMTARVDDGFLFINDIPVGRIAPKTPRVAYNPAAAYWEGRILARQESYYDD